MTDTPSPSEQQSDLAGLRDRFPGFFPPDDVQVKDFITTGMVAFDTNALLDVYRLNPQARAEYLAALRKLGDRLFVPYRVGQELLERRLTVIQECSTATEGFATDLGKAFDAVTKHVRTFGNRRGLSTEQVSELEHLATEACDAITAKAGEFYDFGMDLDASLKGDPILAELVRLLDGKVGPPVADFPAAEAEAKRRIENRIPPGFMDAKKDPERAIGDYLIWRQILDRAAEAGKSVVLVTNDQKPDWAREDLGRKLGAHPDLVAEMMRECGLPFHLVSVQSFLVHAREYLGATVSDSTVAQAEVVQDQVVPFLNWMTSQVHAPDDTSFRRLFTSYTPLERAVLLAVLRRTNKKEISRSSAFNILDMAHHLMDGDPAMVHSLYRDGLINRNDLEEMNMPTEEIDMILGTDNILDEDGSEGGH